MRKMIVGLGNVGEEYNQTRHNAGFLALDVILNHLDKKSKFKLDKKFEASIAKLDDFILVKPQSFMNNSGRVVRKVMDFYKFEISDLIVIHDDLDIRFGEFKIQKGVGPKIHNGLNSIEQSVGEKDFLRVRIGIDSRKPGIDYGSGADYVLGKFSKEEIKTLDSLLETIKENLLLTLKNG